MLRYPRRRRLTQIERAIAPGYSTDRISPLEQNQRVPNPDTVRALFVPALELDNEPELVARLLALARAVQISRVANTEALDSPLAESGATISEARVPATPSSTPVVPTTRHGPRTRPNLVVRLRLLVRRDAAFEVPLTPVSAPTGWGKTSLVAVWILQGSGVSG